MLVRQTRNHHPKTSVIVHIAEPLDESDKRNIESVVKQVEGVVHARFNHSQHHLMIVGYDPNRTNSARILTRVLGQHLHAQLI